MTTNRETMVGGGVFLALVVMMMFSYGGQDVAARAVPGSYLIDATFNRVDGLVEGGEVRLGGKYVRIEAGAEKTYVQPGGAIAKTKDFRSLEDRVGEIIFLATGGDSGGGAN